MLWPPVVELGNGGPRHSWARTLDLGSNLASGICGLRLVSSPKHPKNVQSCRPFSAIPEPSSPLLKCSTLRNFQPTSLLARPDLWGYLPPLLGVSSCVAADTFQCLRTGCCPACGMFAVLKSGKCSVLKHTWHHLWWPLREHRLWASPEDGGRGGNSHAAGTQHMVAEITSSL